MKRASLIGAVLVGLIALGGLGVAFGWCGWTTGHGWARPAGYVRPATTGTWGSYWCCPVMNHPAGYHATYRPAPQQSRLGTVYVGRRFKNARRVEHATQTPRPRMASGGCCCCR